MPLPALGRQQVPIDIERYTAPEILEWSVAAYGRGLTVATAFGAEGCVLIDMVSKIDPSIRVFNLDTGYQFPETLELRERVKERYGIAVEMVQPEESVEEWERQNGGPVYRSEPDRCCAARKLAPLRAALKGYTAWVAAIRRDQTRARAAAGIVDWDTRYNVVKIHPLANWSREDVWAYIRAHDVPYNPLHDQGYPSIGCWPCTKPVIEGEDERAGRWVGFAKTECGLHGREETQEGIHAEVRPASWRHAGDPEI